MSAPAPSAIPRRALLGALGAVAAAGSPPAAGFDAGVLARILADVGGQPARLAAPSISVAVVAGGRTLCDATGQADASTARAAHPGTLYQAASISKFIAALTALTLARSGVVALDADVTGILRRWRLPDSPPGSRVPVTLRRLFGMTSGCDVPGFGGYAVDASLPDELAILDGTPPANSPPVRIVTPPGTVEAYSGGGCQVAQLVMEDAAGQGFADLVDERLLRPLGMTRTQYRWPASALDAAVAHDASGRPVPGGGHVYPELAAAGAWSTPGDLARIVTALIEAAAGGGGLFGPADLVEVLTNVDGLGYGFGTALLDGGRGLMKRGNNLGFRSGLLACPRERWGCVVMTNGDRGEPVVDAVLTRIAGAMGWSGGMVLPE